MSLKDFLSLSLSLSCSIILFYALPPPNLYTCVVYLNMKTGNEANCTMSYYIVNLNFYGLNFVLDARYTYENTCALLTLTW